MCDTDSLYLAIAGPSLDSCVKPGRESEYLQAKKKWLVGDNAPISHYRIPGLFKLEFSGTRFIGLNSKTYCAEGEQIKIGAKGVTKSQNKLLYSHFERVLHSFKPHETVNRGFKLRNHQIHTYVEKKKDLKRCT